MISFLLSFIINYFIGTIFFSFASLVTHLGNPTVFSIFQHLGIAYTENNIISFYSVLVVAVCGLLMLLPPAQRIFALFSGCRTPSPEDQAKIDYAMNRIYAGSCYKPGDFQLFVQNTVDLNAYALGSLTYLDNDELAGILAHEVGHLTHHDTKFGIMAYGMSTAGSIMYSILAVVQNIFVVLAHIPAIGFVFAALSWIMLLFLSFIQLLIRLPFILEMYLSRRAEYAADRYACEIGLGRELYRGLQHITAGEPKMNFFQRLASTHPATNSRLQKISEALP